MSAGYATQPKQCTRLRHALHAEADGVDTVTVMGYEVAGHPSPYEIGSFVLFNEVTQKLKIPVLAGGGIADGWGYGGGTGDGL